MSIINLTRMPIDRFDYVIIRDSEYGDILFTWNRITWVLDNKLWSLM